METGFTQKLLMVQKRTELLSDLYRCDLAFEREGKRVGTQVNNDKGLVSVHADYASCVH